MHHKVLLYMHRIISIQTPTANLKFDNCYDIYIYIVLYIYNIGYYIIAHLSI